MPTTTRYAKSVAKEGNVTEWVSSIDEAVFFPDDVAQEVMTYYSTRPYAGELFFESDKKQSVSASVVEPATV